MADDRARLAVSGPKDLGYAGASLASADALSTSEIKRRSISGAKWLIVMNGIGMPAAFLIALMLGRVGPATLGVYALVQILIGVITTFVVYGGPAVLSVFMPKLTNAEERGRFVFSYLLILLVMMAGMLGLFRLFPGAFEFLLQREFDMRNYRWFMLLALVIVMTETFANAASGLMLIKATAIARQMMRLVLLPVVAVLFLFKQEILINHGTACILGGFLVGYLAAAVVCAISIAREPRLRVQPGWLLPRGFWALSLSSMAATIFTFLYGNFDRLAVLATEDVAGLGMYQAVISINHLIDLVPQMLGSTLVPMFSSLLATGKRESILKAYDLVQKAGSSMMSLAALVLISYSREILTFFGDHYASYSYLLAILCVSSSAHSLFFGNTPVLIAYQRNAFRFGVSTVQIAIQVVGTVCFLDSYGILAVALSKVAGLLFAQVAIISYVLYRLEEGFRVPRTYKAGVLIASATALLRILVLPSGIAFSTAVCVFGFLLFYLVGDLNMLQVRGIARILLGRQNGLQAAHSL